MLALRADQISKSFQGRQVVQSVSFFINTGEIVGLLGPNGAGKTTSFYMIVGLLQPGSGSVYLGKKNITDMPMYRRARAGISYLPQNESIFRKLSVKENLTAIMESIGIKKNERKTLVANLLNKFQIEKISHLPGAALSGGERRRVEIARALIIKPKFLLLDEPFAGVDPVTVKEIQNIIKQLQKEDGLGVLITDHNVRETLGTCDRAYVLANGKIISEGPPQHIANDPSVQSSYLGEGFTL